MADSSATFGVELEQTGAENVTAQLEALRQKILQDTAALREMQGAMRNLKGGSSVNIEAFQQLRDKIDATKNSLAQNQSSFLNLGGAMQKVESAVGGAKNGMAGAADGLRALGQSLRVVDGPAGGFLRKLSAMTKGLGKAGAAGVVLVLVAVLVVLAAALIAAAVAFAEFGIEAANASRNQRISIEELGFSTDKAKKLQETMDALRHSTGVSVNDQVKLLKELKDAHIQVTDEAQRALALAKAGGGDEAVKKLIQEMQNGKTAAAALAEAQKKYGKIVAEKMLELGNQMANFHQDIHDLFKDIAIEPFLKALHQLLSMFNQSTAFGRALHTIITAIGNKLVSWAAAAIPYIISGMKTLMIWGLKLYITLTKFFQSGTGKGLITVLKVIAVVIGVLVAASASFLAIMTALVFGPITAGIAAIAIAISQVVSWISQAWDAATGAFGGIGSAVSGALSAVVGFVGGFISAGGDIVRGLINGITGAGGAFISALVDLAKSGLNAVKGALGIGSPSKAFAILGNFTAQGFAQGVEGGSEQVAGASANMAGAAVGGAASGAGAKPASGGGRTYNITINGVKGAEELKSPSFLAQLAEAIEMASIGAPA